MAINLAPEKTDSFPYDGCCDDCPHAGTCPKPSDERRCCGQCDEYDECAQAARRREADGR